MNLRRRNIFLLVLMILSLLAVGCQKDSGANNADIVAKVDDQVITKDLYNKQLILFKKSYEDMYGDNVWSLDMGGKTFLQAVQENILEKLVNDVAIVKYLQKNKEEIDETEIDEQYTSYMERINDQTEVTKFFEENGIDEAFIKEQIRNDLYMNIFYTKVMDEQDFSDEKLEEYYNQHQEDYRNIQVKASHILVEKEEEAKDILKKINEGNDFAELAKEFSKDPGSAAQGGDLGYFSKGMMVPEFEEAAFSLKTGEISEPVKTQYGYHVIKVFDKVDKMYPFEEVKEDIRTMLADQAVLEKSNEIKNDIKIEKYPENIK